ncbi:MAG: hypothetical protein QOF86_1169 [Baekduia sp.]|nr:hypothetical protein [Baekduia sp.]
MAPRLAAALLLGLVVLAGCGGGSRTGAPNPTSTPAPTATGTATAAPSQGLAVGVTELSPLLVSAPGARDVPQPFARWRDQLAAVHPRYYRLALSWNTLQPDPAQPPNLDQPQTGCMRDKPPCSPWLGVRDQLRALASRQRQGGWNALVVITGAPAWAAAPQQGCLDGSAGTVSAPLKPEALPAYRALIADVLATARSVGATLRYWSPWNEPNLAYFLSPQRPACDASSPSVAAATYTPIAEAMREALAAAPGDQQLVLGETAGATQGSAKRTSVGEFIAGLPRDLVCSAAAWAQHAYVGAADPVDAVSRALDARGCPRVPPIWITETGVGAVDTRFALTRGISSELEGCHRLHDALVRWWRDPRVSAAFQYTFREDNLFRVGLVSTDLATARPVLREWQAWGQRPDPAAPPPADACG